MPTRVTSRFDGGRCLIVLLALGSLLLAGLVGAQPARADVNVYTTPGYHVVNGREWRTTCGPYSSTIDRCRAEIKATQTQYENGRYVTRTAYVFNNLTYLPAPRSQWTGNPLATPGVFTLNGRQWKTECDTAWTGKNACRSFIWATVIEATRSASGTTYQRVAKWVFNNIVLFSTGATPTPTPTTPAPSACTNAPLPSGFAITDGKPHATKTPYSPTTLYNPQNISNFIKLVLVDDRTTDAQKVCLATLGGNSLLVGAQTKPTPSGTTALWFPYMFEFSANPAVPALRPGWISGLAQGGAIGALSALYDKTQDDKWLTAAKRTFESYTVPMSAGGFVNEVAGALWFEEYPTSPPTTVLNGHLEAMIALDLWQRRTHDPRAVALFSRAVNDVRKILPDEKLPVPQGTMSTYDQLRGYTAAPLRVATGSNLVVHSAQQDLPSGAKPLNFPVQAPASDGPNLVTNPGFSTWSNGVPTGWSLTLGALSGVRNSSGSVGLTSAGTGWQSLGQTIDAAKLTPGPTYRLSWRGRTEYPVGEAATSGRVVAVAHCSGSKLTVGESNITRSRAFSQFDMLVKLPATSCSLQILLYQADWKVSNTTAFFDDVSLTRMQSSAGAQTVTWPLSVQAARSSSVTLTTTGTGELQAYDQGRWWSLSKLSSTSPRTVTVSVPQRFTGRNLHYGYHELHVEELVALYRRTADSMFLDYAQAFRPLAPSREALFTNLSTFPYSNDTGRSSGTDRAADPLYDLGTLQPFGVPDPVSPTEVGSPAE